MGSWGDQWVECQICGWGAYGGTDHCDVDGFELTVICKWCLNVPSPPYWPSRVNTRHFIANMKLLPEEIIPIAEVTDLITDFLAQTIWH